MTSVAVAGTGSIGLGFAVLFATHGFTVRCWDALPSSLERASSELDDRVAALEQHGLLEEAPREVTARVSFHEALSDALEEVALVQECAPEDVGLKRSLFGMLAEATGDAVVLASSSSALLPSAYGTVEHAEHRILGAHPGNPPYLLPVIELVPSAKTSPQTLERAASLYGEAGLRAVRVRAEIEGFLFNRLQGAVLREAYCLLRDGIADVDEIDAVMRLGLGRRWAFMGPFETVDLNTRGGIRAHASRMGPAYERMGAERGQHDPWTLDLVDKAAAERRTLLPLEQWSARVRWRDEKLMALRRLLDPPTHT